jgi:hypothetical protein
VDPTCRPRSSPTASGSSRSCATCWPTPSSSPSGQRGLHVSPQAARLRRLRGADSGIGIPKTSRRSSSRPSARPTAPPAGVRRHGPGPVDLARPGHACWAARTSAHQQRRQGQHLHAGRPLEYKADWSKPQAACPHLYRLSRRPRRPRPGLPYRPAPPRPLQPAAPGFADDRHSPFKARTVLVVEDDIGLRASCSTWRTSSTTAAWLRIPPKTASRWPASSCRTPSCWTCGLPDGSGLMVLQRLKETAHPPHARARGVREDRVEAALQMGAIGYARKPATREQLQDVFARLEDQAEPEGQARAAGGRRPRSSESVTHLIATKTRRRDRRPAAEGLALLALADHVRLHDHRPEAARHEPGQPSCCKRMAGRRAPPSRR